MGGDSEESETEGKGEEVVEERVYQGHSNIEMVGLYSDSNGRSCTMHDCCGTTVKKGDLLRLIPTVVTINGKDENAVKFV